VPTEAELTCRFEVAEQTLTAAVSVPSNGQRLPGTETFAWMVLAALAGSVRSDVSGGRATIWLTKKRDGSR
jgi:hypothetical protein